MPLCVQCQTRQASINIIRTVDGVEKANVWLCEECHQAKTKRREAELQGRQRCEFCGGVAYSPVPTLLTITYACCDCRIRFEQIFFSLCNERPDLLERSERDIFYFDLCCNTEIEDWADRVSRRALQLMRSSQGNGGIAAMNQ